MTGIGQRLREERLRRGEEICPIADTLCISGRYLEAIEREDWAQLPGGFFKRSFVRQYAQALGLDPNEFQRALDVLREPEESPLPQLVEAAGQRRISVPPMPTPLSRKRWQTRTFLSLAGLVTVIFACAWLYVAWEEYQFARDDSSVSVAKSQRATPVGQITPVSTAPQAQAPPESAPLEPVPAGYMEFSLTAREDTWIQITAEGKRYFSGILRPGETRVVRCPDRARLTVGNAAGVTVRRAGTDIGPIGGRGQVRVVVFDAGSYEIVPAVPNPRSESD